MPEFRELLNSEAAKKLMNDQNTINRLKNAPETQKLMEMLGNQAGGDLEGMASAAADGNPAQLMTAMQKMLRDPKSKKLLEQIGQSLQF